MVGRWRRTINLSDWHHLVAPGGYRTALLIVFGLLVGLAACTRSDLPGEFTPNAPVGLPEVDIDNFPRMDGSTSTSPLRALVACHLLGVECTWFEGIDGSKIMGPDFTDFEGDFPPLPNSGTHGSYVNLIEGEVDIILVARLPSVDEMEFASVKGVALVPRAVALDAFVFIINENNPVDDLSTEELRGIYTGLVENWEEVGGTNAVINPYQRNENSGSQELMYELVMKGQPMIDAPDLTLPTMMAPFYAVSEDPDGISYSVYYYEEFMAPNEHIDLLGVDGVLPDWENIHDRSYPYTTEVYVVVRNDQDPASSAYQLRDWLLSTEGQDLVAESGYVPVSE